MKPVINLGGIAVLTYVVVIALSILIAVVLIRYYEIPVLKARGQVHPNIVKYNGEVLLVAIIFTVIGARLGYVLVNWSLYADDLPRILALWRGGLAYHGALISALLAVTLHAFLRRIPLGQLLDLGIPYIALAYGIGRLGCFLNGCCFGQATDLPWGMAFQAVDSLTRHPTQLYAAAAAVIIFLVLIRLNRSGWVQQPTGGGSTFAWFLVLHGFYRFINEFYRVSEEWIGPVTMAQVASFIMILGGAAILMVRKNMIGGQRDA